MHITRWVRYSLSLVVVACLAAAVLYLAPISASPVDPQPSGQPASEDPFNGKAGVVDLETLVRHHPDAQKLDQIEQEIAYLNQAIQNSGPSQEDLVKDMRKQLDAMKVKLIKQFQGDVERVKADLDNRKAAVESTLKAEAAGMQGELKAYQDQLMHKAGGADGPITIGPDKNMKAKIELEMARAIEPIMLVAKQKVAARQVEIQQQVEGQMGDAKRRMEQKLAAQMDAVLKADQSQKLQLQLDVQTATDEEQRKKLQDQLQKLNEREDASRDALRKELSAEYDAERQKAIGSHAAELRAYQAKVEGEARAEARSRQAAVLAKYGVAGTGQVKVDNIKSALELKQRELKARLEAHQRALVDGLKSASAQAQAMLKNRQAQIEKQLKDEQQRIIKEVVKRQGKISKEEQARRDHLKSQLDELKAQRDRVYDGIVAQIRDNVAKLAKERQVPLVVGDYRVNLKCQDLTDLALKQAAGSTGTSAGAPNGQ